MSTPGGTADAVLLDAMSESFALHEVVYAASGEAVDYRILECNAAYARITGIPRERARGALASALYGTGTPPYLDVFARVAASGEPERFDTFFPPMAKYFSISVASPGRGRFITVASDVTARVRAEQALAAERDRLAVTIGSIGDAVIATDEAKRITLFNPVAERLTGWSAAQAIGAPLEAVFRIVDEETRQPVESPVDRVLREGVVVGLANHTCLVARDGAERPIADSGAPIREPDGRVAGVVLVFRDQTEARRAERLRAQMAEAQKLETLGRLAGGVAHDFNNLLTVVLSCAAALRDDLGGGAPGDVDDVEAIISAALKARDVTRQLLAFARRQAISPVPLDLNEVLRASENLLRRVLGQAVELTVDLDPELWNVRCDPGQVEQVVLNLAVNARDAMPGGGRLVVRTRNDAAGGAEPPSEWVHLTVEDTGTGMSPEARAHAFEPFFTTKPRGQGTGLGLATVHGIVSQNGGRIAFESELGRGTRFDIRLPRL